MGELTIVRIKQFLADARPGDPPRFVWDKGSVPGLGLKVTPPSKTSTTARGVFVLDARINGKPRRITLGRFGVLTPTEAEKLARSTLLDIAKGIDPVQQRREARDAPSVLELTTAYLEAAEKGLVLRRGTRRSGTLPKRQSTVALDRSLVQRHILPLLGKRKLRDLTRPVMQRFHDDVASGKTATTERTKARGVARVTGGPGIAGRVVELFGSMWKWGEAQGLCEGPSPTTGIVRYRGAPKDRRLTAEEMRRLGAVITAAEAAHEAHSAAVLAAQAEGRRPPRQPAGLHSLSSVRVLTLIALTGLRKGEATNLEWSHVDITAQTITLPTTKTGKSTRPLGAAAAAFLARLPKTHDRFVFAATRGAGPTDDKAGLRALFKAADIDAAPHDLRRTFASIAGDLGFSGGTIGDLLGHAAAGVTETHYVRRLDRVLIGAADATAGEAAKQMFGP